MQTIDFYFNIQKCKSGNLENYSLGKISFVSNTTLNNGVARYVDIVDEKELIGDVPYVAVDGFGFATTQTKPFIGRGNGGVYITSLIPKKEMSIIALAYYAGQIDLQSWRFSSGRRVIKRRLIELKLQSSCKNTLNENPLTNLKNYITLQINNFINSSIKS